MINASALEADYKTMTMKQIADKYGISLTTVFRLCKRYGIKTQKSAIKGVELTETHREVITGSMLGDGCIHKNRNSKNVGLKIEHSIKQADYLDWKYSLLKDLCLKGPTTRENKVALSTGNHPDLLEIHSKWYPIRKKVIPTSEIEQHLTPLCLAIWFMDDGSTASNGVSGRIATASFTFEEVEYLSGQLDRKYGIQSNIYSECGYPRLYIPGRGHFIPGIGWKSNESQFAKLVSLIRPYVPASMSYKLGKV